VLCFDAYKIDDNVDTVSDALISERPQCDIDRSTGEVQLSPS